MGLSLRHCMYDMYADDTTFYVMGRNINDINEKLTADMCAISKWCEVNKMVMNTHKTKTMLLGSHQRLSKFIENETLSVEVNGCLLENVECEKLLGVYIDPTLSWNSHINYIYSLISSRIALLRRNPIFPPIVVGDDLIYASENVKNLGAVFDQNLTMDKHVETFCRSANWQLRNISLLRKYLDDKTCEMLVHAFVTSRLDFLNSLLYGLSDLSIKKLQKIQNSAARIVKRKKRHCNATPLLKELHWLPISARIKFKILLLTFRAQRLEQPVYISQLLAPYVPPRDLRSSDKAYLSLPNPRLKAYGYRCFAYSAPYLWNQLPDHIRFCTELSVFKSYLKTHIFTCSFDCN
ncbi:hypothetical protein HOLleu_21844 [Holothuria leucospilota]|uniref:Reverse transcriptase domain-containing protein n=1 Tax=Holothuria leucospilota TaxID=206669 RepID=A0A9Q1BY33_HOLLE|nr:hypothetical protein HOLleu_21844 [Holothuria leucospilota]